MARVLKSQLTLHSLMSVLISLRQRTQRTWMMRHMVRGLDSVYCELEGILWDLVRGCELVSFVSGDSRTALVEDI